MVCGGIALKVVGLDYDHQDRPLGRGKSVSVVDHRVIATLTDGETVVGPWRASRASALTALRRALRIKGITTPEEGIA